MTSATIFPDTTILIQYQSLDRIDWRSVLGVDAVKVVLTTSVLQEIEDIKNQTISPTLAKRAELTIKSLRALFKREQPIPDHFRIYRAKPPKIDFKLEKLDPNSVADMLVATVIAYQRKQALEYVVLFSDDPETQEKANAAGIEVVSLPKSFLFNEQKPAPPAQRVSEEQEATDEPVTSEADRAPVSPEKNLLAASERLIKPTPLFKNKHNEVAEPVAEEAPVAQHTSQQTVSTEAVQEAEVTTAPELEADNEPEALYEENPQEETQPEDTPQENKLFEVIEPVEPPMVSPVIAVEQEADSELEDEPEGVQASESEASDEEVKSEPPEPVSPFIDIKQEPAKPDLARERTTSSPEEQPDRVAHPIMSRILGQPIHEFEQQSAVAAQQKSESDSDADATANATQADDEPIAHESTAQEVTNESANSELTAVPPAANNQAPLDKQRTTTQSFSFTSAAIPEHAPSSAPSYVPEEVAPAEKSDLRLTFEGDETRSTLIIHHPEYPSIDEVNERIAQLRKDYPKLALLGPSGGDGMGNSISPYNEPEPHPDADLVYQRRNARIKRYNGSLDAFYANSEKYLSEVAEFQNLRRRSAQLNLMLTNDLPDELKSLYIAIHFPSNLRVYSEDNLPEVPVGPTPPEEPNLDALFDRLRLPSVPIPGELSSNSDIKMRSRNLAPLEVRWNKGWDVIYSLREVEKNERIPFNPLYIVFNSFEHATSFRLQFRITVASASYEEKGDLEVLIRKEI